MAKNKKGNLLTSIDFDINNLDCPFETETDRIKYVSANYNGMSIAKCFGVYYNMNVDEKLKTSKVINNIQNIEIGNIYLGTIKEVTKRHILFEIPGVKNEIISKENFEDCWPNIEEYLLTHNNKLLFEVREFKNNCYYVSVIEAYYKQWQKYIGEAIRKEQGIQVHIDSLVRGGYVCHTQITQLVELTGRNYTHSVFIPGSHIVLNIEHDFNRWIDQDVIIVPQKFVEYRRNMRTGEIENSLVGSRKRVLQIFGNQNLEGIYNTEMLISKTGSAKPTYEGTVTGIIRSNNKVGVFVEINDKYITGLMPVDSPEDLLDYKVGQNIIVSIAEFEIQDGKEPFEYNYKGSIKKCNCRPVFTLA